MRRNHKRGHDVKAQEKAEVRRMHRVAYQSFDNVSFDAMLKCAQYAERHGLGAFDERLPVYWCDSYRRYAKDPLAWAAKL